MLIGSCKTTEKTLKEMQYCTTIRVDFTASTIVITDCSDIVVGHKIYSPHDFIGMN